MTNLTDGNDFYRSTSNGEIINGLDGDDIIYGHDGSIIYGDVGDDTLYAGALGGTLIGGPGNEWRIIP